MSTSWAKDINDMNCAPGGRAPTSDTASDPSPRRNHSMCDRPVRNPSAVTA